MEHAVHQYAMYLIRWRNFLYNTKESMNVTGFYKAKQFKYVTTKYNSQTHQTIIKIPDLN